MALLYSITLFVSAFLLFWVQPLQAKMMLPFLGGAPAVWNTCMFFFQVMLLAGYGYAHFVTAKLTHGRQLALQLCILAVAAIVLPFGVSDRIAHSLSQGENPFLWLFSTLLKDVGLPFFIISTNAPLLQHWFSTSRHDKAGDPYFLYAASNCGSLLALLGFPVLLEPFLRLQQQSYIWAALYGGLIVLICICGLSVRQAQGTVAASPLRVLEEKLTIPMAQKVRWVAWSFIPSSLMLGLTTYLTTDIATIPLLWVIPLSLYLVTFILVFGRRSLLSVQRVAVILPVAALALVFLMLIEATEPAWLLIVIHLTFFFIASMLCHGRLAADRPPPQGLTEFFFWMSVGGVLGGLFNALLAPLIFTKIVEYPLLMVLACLCIPRIVAERKEKQQGAGVDVVLAMGVGLLSLVIARVLPASISSGQLQRLLIFGVPLILCYFFTKRPVRFALGLGALFIAGNYYANSHTNTLERHRNFFGTSRVTMDADGFSRRIYHGNTVHGRQFVASDRQCEPLSYYHRQGPLGEFFNDFANRPFSAPHVAAIGLGAGAVTAYSKPGETWTFYEIDPAVIEMAKNTYYFTYLSNCGAVRPNIIAGDARLQLREAPEGYYGLIILDAFSSDSIPMHLITKQAVELYLSKLAPDGVLAWHISNRYLDLQPIMGDLAGSLNLVCYSRYDAEVTEAERLDGKDPSHWVVFARREADLRQLPASPLWHRLTPRPQPTVWTDDFSNIIGVFRWK